MEHGLLMLEGGGIYRLGDGWYPVDGGRFHLDGALLPAVVRRARQERRRNTSSTKTGTDEPRPSIDDRARPRARDAGRFLRAPPPVVTRVVFTRGRSARPRISSKRLCARRRPRRSAKTPSATPSRAGRAPTRNCRAVATGSHIDAIPQRRAATTARSACSAGWKRSARCSAQGFRPRRSIELILFTSEEPTRFGIGCLGSRLLAGMLDAAAGERLRDHDGKSLDEVRAARRLHGTARQVPLAGRATTHAFVELHIEQGPLLEQRRTRRSAWSRPSPRRPACGSRSKAKAATPARS